MAVLDEIKNHDYESCGLTEFAQAMPDEYKVPESAVDAYRQFYRGEKMGFARWTKRDIPVWILSHENK